MKILAGFLEHALCLRNDWLLLSHIVILAQARIQARLIFS
jgi:hypothetical protein